MLCDQKVKYMEYRESGTKIKGAGFVKMERWGDSCRILVQISGLPANCCGEKNVYLTGERTEILLGAIYLDQGRGRLEFQGEKNFRSIESEDSFAAANAEMVRIPIAPEKEVVGFLQEMSFSGRAGSSRNVPEKTETLSGIRKTEQSREVQKKETEAAQESERTEAVTTETGMAAQQTQTDSLKNATQPKPESIRMPEVKETAQPKPESIRMPEVKETAQPKPESIGTQEVKKTAQPKPESIRMPEVKETAQPKPESIRMPEVKETAQPEPESIGTQEVKKTAQPEQYVFGTAIQPNKWEQLYAIYPKMKPFGDNREYLRISPGDFVVLKDRSYRLANNSFLLHGYFNFKHLILHRTVSKGENIYFVGVPGNFYDKEKEVAVLFGFESFESAREPAREGDFGYYMMRVEL